MEGGGLDVSQLYEKAGLRFVLRGEIKPLPSCDKRCLTLKHGRELQPLIMEGDLTLETYEENINL